MTHVETLPEPLTVSRSRPDGTWEKITYRPARDGIMVATLEDGTLELRIPGRGMSARFCEPGPFDSTPKRFGVSVVSVSPSDSVWLSGETHSERDVWKAAYAEKVVVKSSLPSLAAFLAVAASHRDCLERNWERAALACLNLGADAEESPVWREINAHRKLVADTLRVLALSVAD